MKPLTKNEQKYAEENHNLIYEFLCRNKLDVDEYYDVVILRYLSIVQCYLNSADLQKHKFSTVANKAMTSAVYNYQKDLKKELGRFITIDSIKITTDYENFNAIDIDETAILNIVLDELSESISPLEFIILNDRINGYTFKELSEIHHLSVSGLAKIFYKTIKKIKLMYEV